MKRLGETEITRGLGMPSRVAEVVEVSAAEGAGVAVYRDPVVTGKGRMITPANMLGTLRR